MENLKKYVAEFIGTAVLVIMGCGTAMLLNANSAVGYMLTAAAFGLVIVGMAYCVGNISGCHINPAVSLGVLITGGITPIQYVGYVIAQILGAFAGSELLAAIFNLGDLTDQTGAFGSNGLAGVHDSYAAGFLVEAVLTFIFVFVVIGVTSKKANHGSFGGLAIGGTLSLVHILGIGLTGTSVNPARSLGPALTAWIDGNSSAINVVWVFVLAPLVGAALAAIVYMFLESSKKEEVKADDESAEATEEQAVVNTEA